jgi:ankyrin repeat protein
MSLTIELIKAVKANKKKAVQLLLERGADPNGIEDGDNITPLHFAYLYKAHRVMPLLVAAGADINAKNIDGLKPEYYA